MAVLASAFFAGVAQGAFSAATTRAFPLPAASETNSYAPGFGGAAGHGESFWTVSKASNTGYVGHFDDEGNNLGDGFSFTYSGIFPLDVGYFGGRVFITLGGSGAGMIGVAVGGDHNILSADSETNSRMGGNQKTLRTYSSGSAALGFGQNNKVATIDLTGGGANHPWYRQTFMGAGINKPYDDKFGGDFETCAVGPGAVGGEYGEPPKCGTYSQPWMPGKYEGFNYPNDVAFGAGGVYVSEWSGNRVSHVDTVSNPGARLDFRFGIGPGTASGQLDKPQSVVVQPGTGNVFVSEEGNRRISVFNNGGGYIASFGYGVLNGADEMQVCGVEIGQCRAGVDYKVDNRSLFTQLDFGPEGELYAWMPLAKRVQVFSVSGAGGPAPPAPGTGGAGAGGAGAGAGDASEASVKQKVRLGAAPLKVKKDKKTTLTATVNGGASCANRVVLFQTKASRSWDNLGKAVKAGKGCKARRSVKVTEKTVFRAVLIDSTNQATLASSPNVTVKLK